MIVLKRLSIAVVMGSLLLAGCGSSGSSSAGEPSAKTCTDHLKPAGVFACEMNINATSDEIAESERHFGVLAQACPGDISGDDLANMASTAKDQVGDSASYQDIYDNLSSVVSSAGDSSMTCVEAMSAWVVIQNPDAGG